VLTLEAVLKSRVTATEAANGQLVPTGLAFDKVTELAETAYLLGEVAVTHKLYDVEPYKPVINQYLTSTLGDKQGWRSRLGDFDKAVFVKKSGLKVHGETEKDTISGKAMLEMVALRKMLNSGRAMG
jgi:hypothetical protein